MQSKKRLALVINQVSDETTETETSSAEKCKQLNDKCDIVLDKIKTKKARLNKVIEIK